MKNRGKNHHRATWQHVHWGDCMYIYDIKMHFFTVYFVEQAVHYRSENLQKLSVGHKAIWERSYTLWIKDSYIGRLQDVTITCDLPINDLLKVRHLQGRVSIVGKRGIDGNHHTSPFQVNSLCDNNWFSFPLWKCYILGKSRLCHGHEITILMYSMCQ